MRPMGPMRPMGLICPIGLIIPPSGDRHPFGEGGRWLSVGVKRGVEPRLTKRED